MDLTNVGLSADRQDDAAPPGGPGMSARLRGELRRYPSLLIGGDLAAVVVPMADFLRLRALEQRATDEELEDAEDTAAVAAFRARDAAGQTVFVPAAEARRRLGL